MPPVQDLDHALQLLRPADHPVQLALPGPLVEIDAVIVEELVLPRSIAALPGALGGIILPALGTIGVVVVLSAEEPVQEGKGGGFAVVVRVVGIIFDLHQPLTVAGEGAHGVHHLSGEVFQLLITDAHFCDHVIDGLDVQLSGALQAKPLLLGLAVFDPVDKHHSHVFMAPGAKSRLHSTLLSKSI